MGRESKKGRIFVISGPSGVGKGTLLRMLFERHPEISLSVSATTRSPRPGEFDGINYFFVTREKFQELINKDGLLEWAEFAGNYYGTPVQPVEDALFRGKNIALEIEVKGAMQVKKKFPESILIFITPPSFEELESRLVRRNTESREIIEKRLAVVKTELEKSSEFDYVIVNDNLEDALIKLEQTIDMEINTSCH